MGQIPILWGFSTIAHPIDIYSYQRLTFGQTIAVVLSAAVQGSENSQLSTTIPHRGTGKAEPCVGRRSPRRRLAWSGRFIREPSDTD